MKSTNIRNGYRIYFNQYVLVYPTFKSAITFKSEIYLEVSTIVVAGRGQPEEILCILVLSLAFDPPWLVARSINH